MSTPMVSGVAAIHLQKEPFLTPAELRDRLTGESIKGHSISTAFRSILGHQLPINSCTLQVRYQPTLAHYRLDTNQFVHITIG